MQFSTFNNIAFHEDCSISFFLTKVGLFKIPLLESRIIQAAHLFHLSIQSFVYGFIKLGSGNNRDKYISLEVLKSEHGQADGH